MFSEQDGYMRMTRLHIRLLELDPDLTDSK